MLSTKSLNVLVVSQVYYPETFCITQICEELVNRGHKVTIITGIPNYGKNTYYEGYDKHPKDEVINGVNVFRCKVTPRKKGVLSLIRNYLSFYFYSKKRVRHLKEKYDVIYSMCLSPLTAMCAANLYVKLHKGVKHIHHCLDVWPDSMVETGYIRKPSLLYKIIKKACIKIYNPMDKILVSSPCFIDYFINELHISKDKLELVRQPNFIYQKLGESVKYKNKYNLVYAGNIGKLQDLSSIILAFNYLKDLDICFHILGIGSCLEDTLKLIKDNHLEDYVIYEGLVAPNQVVNYFTNADIGVISLKKGSTVVSKTIPKKLVTYFFFKKPIVGIISGDGKDILINNSNPWISDIGDPHIISELIKDCLSDTQKQMKAINDLTAFYNKEYSFNNILDLIEKELINSLD